MLLNSSYLLLTVTMNGYISVDSRSLSSNSSTAYSPVTTGTFATLFQIKIMQFIDDRDQERFTPAAMPTEAVLSYEVMS